MFSTIVILALSVFWAQQADAVACYTPNGQDRNAQLGYDNLESYAPCSRSSNNSMCCAWGSSRTNSGTADTCLSNGLCQGGGNTWRESCTDPTWQAPECLKLFVNGTGYYGATDLVYDDSNQLTTDVTVTECDNGSFCFGTGNRACCQQGQGVWLNAQGVQTNINPSTTSTASSTSSTSSSTTSTTTLSSTTASPSAASTPQPSSGLSTGAKAGIGGGVAGAAAVVANLAACWYVRRKKKRTQHSQPSVTEQTHFSDAPSKHKNSELQVAGTGKDYPGPYPRHEMESPLAARLHTDTKRSALVEMP